MIDVQDDDADDTEVESVESASERRGSGDMAQEASGLRGDACRRYWASNWWAACWRPSWQPLPVVDNAPRDDTERIRKPIDSPFHGWWAVSYGFGPVEI